MMKLLIGLTITGITSVFGAIETYDCRTLHSVYPTPDLNLNIETPFFEFNPVKVNGMSVIPSKHYSNFFKMPQAKLYKISSEVLYFMEGTSLNSFYKEKDGDKVYMFNHAFPDNRWHPEESPAYLSIKQGNRFSYYGCKFLSTTSWW